jgi:hypothetical protein
MVNIIMIKVFNVSFFGIGELRLGVSDGPIRIDLAPPPFLSPTEDETRSRLQNVVRF